MTEFIQRASLHRHEVICNIRFRIPLLLAAMTLSICLRQVQRVALVFGCFLGLTLVSYLGQRLTCKARSRLAVRSMRSWVVWASNQRVSHDLPPSHSHASTRHSFDDLNKRRTPSTWTSLGPSPSKMIVQVICVACQSLSRGLNVELHTSSRYRRDSGAGILRSAAVTLRLAPPKALLFHRICRDDPRVELAPTESSVSPDYRLRIEIRPSEPLYRHPVRVGNRRLASRDAISSKVLIW